MMKASRHVRKNPCTAEVFIAKLPELSQKTTQRLSAAKNYIRIDHYFGCDGEGNTENYSKVEAAKNTGNLMPPIQRDAFLTKICIFRPSSFGD